MFLVGVGLGEGELRAGVHVPASVSEAGLLWGGGESRVIWKTGETAVESLVIDSGVVVSLLRQVRSMVPTFVGLDHAFSDLLLHTSLQAAGLLDDDLIACDLIMASLQAVGLHLRHDIVRYLEKRHRTVVCRRDGDRPRECEMVDRSTA